MTFRNITSKETLQTELDQLQRSTKMALELSWNEVEKLHTEISKRKDREMELIRKVEELSSKLEEKVDQKQNPLDDKSGATFGNIWKDLMLRISVLVQEEEDAVDKRRVPAQRRGSLQNMISRRLMQPKDDEVKERLTMLEKNTKIALDELETKFLGSRATIINLQGTIAMQEKTIYDLMVENEDLKWKQKENVKSKRLVMDKSKKEMSFRNRMKSSNALERMQKVHENNALQGDSFLNNSWHPGSTFGSIAFKDSSPRKKLTKDEKDSTFVPSTFKSKTMQKKCDKQKRTIRAANTYSSSSHFTSSFSNDTDNKRSMACPKDQEYFEESLSINCQDSIFSGKYDLNKSKQGTSSLTLDTLQIVKEQVCSEKEINADSKDVYNPVHEVPPLAIRVPEVM